MDLTHFQDGRPRMVDVTEKPETFRTATAEAFVELTEEALSALEKGGVGKGDPLVVAQLAGILAAKKTADLIPLCHPLPLTGVEVRVELLKAEKRVRIEATVKTKAETGVEMEAMTACAVAALTVYDMCKAVDRGMVIRDLQLEEKRGGKSGCYRRRKD